MGRLARRQRCQARLLQVPMQQNRMAKAKRGRKPSRLDNLALPRQNQRILCVAL